MSAVAQYSKPHVVQSMKFEMQDYTAEMFSCYLGQVLEFDQPMGTRGINGNRVQLELLEVRRPKSAPRPVRFREPFALLFALRSAAPLARGLQRISHADFEPVDWFVARVWVPGRDPNVAYYEAVFG